MSALCAIGPRFNPGPGILFIYILPNVAVAAFYYLLNMQHLSDVVSLALFITFFNMVNQRFCSDTG